VTDPGKVRRVDQDCTYGTSQTLGARVGLPSQ